MSITSQIDARSNDRPDIAGRVERVVVDILQPRLTPGADIRPFHREIPTAYEDEDESPVSRDYFQIKAMRGAENPSNSCIYTITVEVIGHGQISPSDIDRIETAFASARHLSMLFREHANANGLSLPGGWPVSMNEAQAERTGAGNDFEVRWTFTVHAQALEISQAAA
jgi:hypothetical protein